MSCLHVLPSRPKFSCLFRHLCRSSFTIEVLPLFARQERLNGSQGGGAILLVIKGTAHHTFTDVVPYFQVRFSWLIRMVS